MMRIKKSLKVNVNSSLRSLCSYLCLLGFIPPACIFNYGAIDILFSGLKAAAIFYTLILVIIKRYKITPYVFLMCLAQLCILLSTILYSGSLKQYFNVATQIVFTLIYVDLERKKDTEEIIRRISNVLSAYTIANCLTYIIFPEGLYLNMYDWPCYFLGYRNVANQYLIAAILFRYLYDIGKQKRVSPGFFLVYFCSLFFVLATWSATGIAGIVLIGIGLFFSPLLQKRGFISLTKVLVVTIIIFVILLFQNQLYEILLKDIVQQWLHRDISFTGRNELWEILWNKLRNNSILLGFGIKTWDQFVNTTGIAWAGHAHNQILQIMWEGGMLSFGIHYFAFLYSAHRFDKFNQSKKGTYSGLAIVVASFVFLTMMQMEVYSWVVLFYIILLFACNGAKWIRI